MNSALFSSISQWENWVPCRLGDVSKVPELVSDRVEQKINQGLNLLTSSHWCFHFTTLSTQHYISLQSFYKVFSQAFYHLVLSAAQEEKQSINSTGEQTKILLSFPAWSHPTRDCPCVLTPSTGPTVPLHLTRVSPQGWVAPRTSANPACTFISSWICNIQTMRGLRYIPACSFSSLLAFQSIRISGGSSHLPHTPNYPAPLCLDHGYEVGWWI